MGQPGAGRLPSDRPLISPVLEPVGSGDAGLSLLFPLSSPLPHLIELAWLLASLMLSVGNAMTASLSSLSGPSALLASTPQCLRTRALPLLTCTSPCVG